MKKSKLDITMVELAGSDKYHRSGSGGLLRSGVKFACYCYAKLFGANHFAKKLDAMGKKRPYEDKYVNLTVWATGVKPFERAFFDEVTRMQFEDAMLCVPSRYDEILKQCYGDYMKLPPADQQIAHHYYTAYLLEDENT